MSSKSKCFYSQWPCWNAAKWPAYKENPTGQSRWQCKGHTLTYVSSLPSQPEPPATSGCWSQFSTPLQAQHICCYFGRKAGKGRMEDSVKQKKQEKIGGKDREKWKKIYRAKERPQKQLNPSQIESNSLRCQIPFQVYIKTKTKQKLSTALGLHKNIYIDFKRETVQLLFGCTRDQL